MIPPNIASLDEPGRTERKRRAILSAASEIFLHSGYPGTSMDEVAQRAEVSKQTVYKQFASKEALFVAVMESMTGDAAGRVQGDRIDPAEGEDVGDYLRARAGRLLEIVLTPRLMQLRRLVIGEANRFPDLGKALYANGPQRSIDSLAGTFARLAERGVLAVDDPVAAARDFNWLVMGEPVNRVMMLGDGAIPDAGEQQRQAENAVAVFLRAYSPTGFA